MILRYKPEKIEKMSKQDEVFIEEWDYSSRLQKWKIIFNTNEDCIFYDFVICVKDILNDATNFVRTMKRMYLSNCIHQYVETGEIKSTVFQEQFLNCVAAC